MVLSNIICAIPDYLPLTFKQFIGHYANLLTDNTYDLFIPYEEYTKVIGYAARSIFEICLMYFSKGKENFTIATTPLNHTSFRNAIEKYAKPENIHVIDFSEKLNKINHYPEIDHCDVAVITHLFGQDLDLGGLAAFKKKHNCIIMEDRVQGGTLNKKFSDDLIDISIYSMAMDKRPVALGGGYMHIRNKFPEIIKATIEMIGNLPLEPNKDRFNEFMKKVPTILIYNTKIVPFLLIQGIKLAHKFVPKISVLQVTGGYRKSNPGFSHFNFMKRPSKGLAKSVNDNHHNYFKMERLYRDKYRFFYGLFPPKLLEFYFPWYRGNDILTPYNTIQLEEDLVDKFLKFFDIHNTSAIWNPTYKMFNFPYKGDKKYLRLNNGIIYVPSVANMHEVELKHLASRMIEFYLKFVVDPEKKETLSISVPN